jgi:hypothetical protein
MAVSPDEVFSPDDFVCEPYPGSYELCGCVFFRNECGRRILPQDRGRKAGGAVGIGMFEDGDIDSRPLQRGQPLPGYRGLDKIWVQDVEGLAHQQSHRAGKTPYGTAEILCQVPGRPVGGWIGGGPYRFWYGDKPRPIWSNWWIGNVMLGMGRLDISGESYHALLRAARMRLLACFVLFMILVAGLGWSTQGSMDRALLARVNAEYEALVVRGLIGQRSGGVAQKPRMLNTYVGDAVAPVSQGKSAPIVLPQSPHMATPDAH